VKEQLTQFISHVFFAHNWDRPKLIGNELRIPVECAPFFVVVENQAHNLKPQTFTQFCTVKGYKSGFWAKMHPNNFRQKLFLTFLKRTQSCDSGEGSKTLTFLISSFMDNPIYPVSKKLSYFESK
jgi:hypothetical protein